MAGKLKVGIVGVGGIASVHLPSGRMSKYAEPFPVPAAQGCR